MSMPMPSLPKGYQVNSRYTAGFRIRWRAVGPGWVGPDRKSERSAVHDAIKAAA